MSDTNINELDAMLTLDEDAGATTEEPSTDDTGDDQPKGAAAQADGKDSVDGSAGRQSDITDDGDAHDDKQTETDKVPVATLIEQRRAFRSQIRATHDQVLDLKNEIAELRTQRQTVAEDNGEDGDEPLTKAEFRKLQREQESSRATLTREQQETRIGNALRMGDPNQQRLLQLSQQYLSKADERRIIKADDVLATAVQISRERLEAFGADDEVRFLESAFPDAKQSPSHEQAAASRDKTNGKATAKAKPAETDPDEDPHSDVDSQTKALLDYMFKG